MDLRRANAMDNSIIINSLHDNIRLNNYIIADTKRWLKRQVESFTLDEITEATLKQDLKLGAELIKNCEWDTGRTRAEIHLLAKYPLGSSKSRDWYKTKEGQRWLEKNLPKKN